LDGRERKVELIEKAGEPHLRSVQPLGNASPKGLMSHRFPLTVDVYGSIQRETRMAYFQISAGLTAG
jgi:hypothetical protein